ncbi:MAG: endonuclease/exonuclease/phosphatase family protein [Chloroflexi bacterium]|nr:endonuclease/exonuclease/phosphatase family protein [Chloroflexota bacterium]
MGVTVVSWNIATRIKPWQELVEMDADVALLQEAKYPPADIADHLDIGPQESWDSHSWNSDWWRGRGWRALYERWPMVVRLSDRVDVKWFRQVSPDGWPEKDEISVSGIGTITAARVTPKDGSIEPFMVASMYGRWVGPHPSIQASWQIYADASVHRIISDLSAFIGHDDPRTHRILAAGDLNITYGYGHGSGPYWDRRYETVFERMESIGLEFLGPQLPNGRKAEILATGEPEDSENVVTYHLPNRTPATASNNQFDFAFASRGFHENVNVRALNEVEQWGSSDHCRLLIEIGE